jgi:hypothetical protein
VSTSWGTGSDVEDQALAATAALCAAAGYAAADAEEYPAGIDPELPGLLTAEEL